MACKTRIELSPRKEVYTCGDLIHGKVIVTLTKDISVKQIVIKLKGKSKVTIGEGEYRSVLGADLFHKELVVFPPPQHAQQFAAQQMSKVTLTKGIYEYPFEFQLPGHGEGDMASLLPTLSVESNRIYVRYYIKATIRRAARFAVNPRIEYDIRTSPCVDRTDLENYTLLSVNGAVNLKSSLDSLRARLVDSTPDPSLLRVEFRYPAKGLRPSAREELSLGLFVSLTGKTLPQRVSLTSISLYLYRHGVYKTDIAEAKTKEKILLEQRDLSHVLDFNRGSRLDVSELLNGIRFKALCIPSFGSRLIDIQYDIGMTVSFNTDFGRRRLELTGRTSVLPVVVHRHGDTSEELPQYSNDQPPEYVFKDTDMLAGAAV